MVKSHDRLRKDEYKQQKQDEAFSRQTAYNKLSTKGRIRFLDRQFGEGQGAKKQRAKLKRELSVNRLK